MTVFDRPRYPQDIDLGIAGAIVGYASAWTLGTSALAIPSALLAGLSLMIAASDLRRFIIPDHLVIILAIVGLARALAQSASWEVLTTALAQSLLYGGSFLLIRSGYAWVRHRHGLGLGDVKLAAAAGGWLEPALFGQAVALAAIAGLAAVLLRAARRGRLSRTTTLLPLGAFLAPSIWIVWVSAYASLG